MTDLAERFRAWMAANDHADDPATPSATVLVLRDGDDGLEVLMVKRNARGMFANNWVFPGGKIDPEDYPTPDDVIGASRNAAIRETTEEADVVIDPDTVLPFSHWMPPRIVPRRFATWFYAAAVPAGEAGAVTIDGAEIVDHAWMRPSDVLERHAAGEVEFAPPTWVTLHDLADYANVESALTSIAGQEPSFFVTRRIATEPPTVAWHDDAAYENGDADTPGSRHRLVMQPGGWTYEREL